MANFLSKMKTVITSIKNLPELLNERDALKRLYEQSNICQGLVPGNYYQSVDPGTGNVKGYSAVCLCGKENRIHSLHEVFAQDLACPTCKMEINILKKLGAVDAEGKLLITVQEVRRLLSKLPVRPAVVEKRTPFLSTDGGDSGGDSGSGFPRNDARTRAFESGDPGSMGPGF